MDRLNCPCSGNTADASAKMNVSCDDVRIRFYYEKPSSFSSISKSKEQSIAYSLQVAKEYVNEINCLVHDDRAFIPDVLDFVNR